MILNSGNGNAGSPLKDMTGLEVPTADQPQVATGEEECNNDQISLPGNIFAMIPSISDMTELTQQFMRQD